MKKAFILSVCVLVLAGVMLACGASTDNQTSTVVAKTTAAPTTAPVQAKHFKAGDVVKVGDTWQVTVNSIATNPGDQFTTPKAGNQFVVVDVTVKNLSSQSKDMSSGLNFELKDSTGQKYQETILTGETPPDGTVAAGDNLRGQLTYEVPASMKAFTFSFQADAFGGDPTLWDLSL